MDDSTTAEDRTILVPRPGGKPLGNRASPAPAASPSITEMLGETPPIPKSGNSLDGNADRTVVPGFVDTKIIKQGIVPGIGANPILDAAATALSLLAQIRNTTSHQDVKVLHQQCIELIREFEHRLRGDNLDQEIVYSARYCLCAILDETVLNTPWGGNSFWGMESLLSAYHKETLGGEHFFNILDEAISNPQKHIHLIEFQYICLSLGFEGKMRLEERGATKLDELRERVYRIIRDTHGEYERELSPAWSSEGLKGDGLVDHMPIWVIIAIIGALMLTSFMLFRYNLNNETHTTLSRLYTLVNSPDKEQVSSPSQLDRLLQLQQLLQAEIQRGFLTVVDEPGKIIIRFKAENLFSSASATINESFNPILVKLALTLEKIPGQITVVGHTDDVSIFSYQFRSNFELSLERANSVVKVMKENAQLDKRIISEGKADLEPLVENTNAANRALNRRVEVVITEF
ncbi:type IVB secretion system protein IcmH/DotU [Aliikangiella maris]|uniref:Type IVB secretion system protein IcmH/DotU n=2 Tax=Aliikangiella maris TaxID=3162458 RepID=A0ABV2BSP7_9GAMM